MASRRLKAKLDSEDDKILLPASSEDELEPNSELSDEELEIADPFPNEEDSDSDDAPDAVSFKSALEDTKSFKRQATQVIKTQLDERRKKRKELHDNYMLQKEEKRQKIDSKKLPEDLLESLKDDPIPEEQVCKEDESSSNDEKEPTEEVSSENIGIHGPTMFKCKVLAVESKKPKYIPEKVANFKDNLLYGGRIRREKNARVAMLKTEKQQVRLKFLH